MWKEFISILALLGVTPQVTFIFMFLVVIYLTIFYGSKKQTTMIIDAVKKDREYTTDIIIEHKKDVKDRFDEYRREDHEYRIEDRLWKSKNESDMSNLASSNDELRKKFDELKMYDEMRKRMYAGGDVRFVKSTKQEYITKIFREFERGILSWDPTVTYDKGDVAAFYEEIAKNISTEFLEKYRKFGFDETSLNAIKMVDSLISPISWGMVEDIINTFVDGKRYGDAVNEIIRFKVDNYMNQYINKWNQIFDEYTHTLPTID